jgi:hypothetical protein
MEHFESQEALNLFLTSVVENKDLDLLVSTLNKVKFHQISAEYLDQVEETLFRRKQWTRFDEKMEQLGIPALFEKGRSMAMETSGKDEFVFEECEVPKLELAATKTNNQVSNCIIC